MREAVAGPELALDVGRSDVARRLGHERARARVRAPRRPVVHEAESVEDGAGGRDGGHTHRGVSRREMLGQLLRPPVRVRRAAADEERLDVRRGAVGLCVPGVGAVGERVGATVAVAVDPRVGVLRETPARRASSVAEKRPSR